jgi:hypothetical protein
MQPQIVRDLFSYQDDGKGCTIIAGKGRKSASEYVTTCIDMRTDDVLISAEADADRSSGYMHDGDTDHLFRCDLRWPA